MNIAYVWISGFSLVFRHMCSETDSAGIIENISRKCATYYIYMHPIFSSNITNMCSFLSTYVPCQSGAPMWRRE